MTAADVRSCMRRIYKRKSIRLKGYDYSKAGLYFITINVDKRVHLFGEIRNRTMVLSPFGKVVQSHWDALDSCYADVLFREYVVMPDHFHCLLEITGEGKSLDTDSVLSRRNMIIPIIVGRFKMQTAKEINRLRDTPGQKVWQRNYYERIIHDRKSSHVVSQYIRNNPIKWRGF